MAKPEGWYCQLCDKYHGETGHDAQLCDCGGPKEYREWIWCASCGDEALTADTKWNCEDECDQQGDSM